MEWKMNYSKKIGNALEKNPIIESLYKPLSLKKKQPFNVETIKSTY